MDHANVAAGLPGHFSPHSLRHIYASCLLADGVSPAFVREQLELTVGTHGQWLRKRSPAAVDKLDDASPEAVGGRVVVGATTGSDDDSQVVDRVGDPP